MRESGNGNLTVELKQKVAGFKMYGRQHYFRNWRKNFAGAGLGTGYLYLFSTLII